MNPAKLAKVKKCFVRKGKVIHSKDGKSTTYVSVNGAKKVSTDLQTKGLGKGQVIAWKQ